MEKVVKRVEFGPLQDSPSWALDCLDCTAFEVVWTLNGSMWTLNGSMWTLNGSMWIDVDLDGSIDGTALDIPCGHAESARNAVDKAYMDHTKGYAIRLWPIGCRLQYKTY